MRVLAVAVHSSEVERPIRRFPPAARLRHGVHRGRVKKVRLTARDSFGQDVTDGEHVGHHPDIVIGHALRHPYGAEAGGVRQHVEDEALARVDDLG